MITEDYVSFEIAKLLKEKGFDEATRCCYSNKGTRWLNDFLVQHNSQGGITCPTLQMAMKWLREVHKIHVVVYPYGEYFCDNYQFDVYKNNEFIVSKDDGYVTYEQACEAALKYSLENLI